MSTPTELLVQLVKKNYLSAEQVDSIVKSAAAANKSVEAFVLEQKLVDQEKLVEAEADLHFFKYKNLTSKKISESALHIIPNEVAENYNVICFEADGSELKVGITDSDNLRAIEAIKFLAKEHDWHLDWHLISRASFDHAIKQYKSLSQEISVALQIKAEEEQVKQEKQKEDEEKYDEIIGSAPVIKIVSVIMRHAVEGGASDIHIEPLQKESRVRYRIDGILKTSLVLPRNIHDALVARIKVMSNLKLDETRVPQDGRIRQVINGKEVDFRVSTLPLTGEEKVVMRVLDVTKGAPTLDDLGFSGHTLAIIMENIKKTNKMFLVVGPTGSGKSTTLYSVLNLVNKEGVNISTLEDPVEYFMPGVNQSQVKPEVGFTFATGLRALLRQDPNIIMVGEIRDSETAELGIHASLTGHFVLSTLHTNDAIGTIPRLLDMKVEAFLLGSTLSTVLAQRLTRKICAHCKTAFELSGEVLTQIKAQMVDVPAEVVQLELPGYSFDSMIFYKGKGCNRCANTGYQGRVAVAEIIDVNDKLRNIIIDSGHAIKIEDVKNSQLFITMMQDGIIKSLKGLTTIEEVFRVMRD
ncbi:MAG: ATPase, T2SS/T4P/T4SS family [Candidatus Falkowbacteria bacterium]